MCRRLEQVKISKTKSSSTRPTTRSCRDPGRQVPKAVEHQDEEAPFWRRPSPTTPTSTSSLAARPQTRPSPASSPATPRGRAASGTSLTHWDCVAKLPGDVLLAGLMAAYTKHGIFASLFILHSVSAAPKPWCYALYIPGSVQGLVGASFPRGTSAQRTAPSRIGGSRARHSEDFFRHRG